MRPTYYTVIDSPIGALMLVGDDAKLRGLHFVEGRRRREPAPGWVRDASLFVEAERQMAEYFAGTRRVFELSLETGGTPFQRAVWSALEGIPYGQTISYSVLAPRIGNPRAVRAVGLANGSNPIALVIPCHRVIGANGSLVGYGGGIDRKTFLLDFERRIVSGAELERLVSGGLALHA
jgi:methylated-DNA-[protein]-cysteine S-methyltransferase